MSSTPTVWKQYNKMAVLHFFLVNSTLIYILFSLLFIYYDVKIKFRGEKFKTVLIQPSPDTGCQVLVQSWFATVLPWLYLLYKINCENLL